MSPKVIFLGADGHEHAVEATVGISLMEIAKEHGIAGIVAQCGGACACATCHVYVDADWVRRLPPPEDMEIGMLENALKPRANSRLSCQIAMSAALDGLKVTVPEAQA